MGKWLAQFRDEKNFPEIPNRLTDIGDVGHTSKENGKVIQLHRMRPACKTAGHCLGLTAEQDCELYLVRPGWCRQREGRR